MQQSKFKLAHIMLRQELRILLNSSTLWGLLIILSLLVGYSFVQAVKLFSQASQTALAYPALAAGMNPLEGIFVPTFGAYYLVETLLLPFVIIRLTGQDKLNGTLKLLLQLPLSPLALNGLKLLAIAAAWLLISVPAISVLMIWKYLGGTTYLPEILCLAAGHALYTLTIVNIALFATAISDSLPTAAMICLGTTLGSWVLDFAAGGSGWLGKLGAWSLTTQLRQFENGLLSTNSVFYFLGLSLLFFITATIWVHPGVRLKQKITKISCAILLLLIAVAGIIGTPKYLDLTENLKHSFDPATTLALKQLAKPLKITIHLNRDDSRFYDFEHEILTKLRRTVPHLKIIFSKSKSAGLFAASDNDNYGLIEYDYAGKHDESYSNSPEEILPLLQTLAGQKIKPEKGAEYTGHPLVADAADYQWWFNFGLPLLFLLAAWQARKQ